MLAWLFSSLVYLDFYEIVIYYARKSAFLLCGRDFANKRLLLCQFQVKSS